jgi:hypothetical protein
MEIFLPCAKQANTLVRNRRGNIAAEISRLLDYREIS